MWGYRPMAPLDADGKQTIDLENDFLDPAQWNTNRPQKEVHSLQNNGYLHYGVNGSVINTQFTGWSNENILTWNKTFTQKHNLILTGVVSEQGGLYTLDGASAVKLPKAELGQTGHLHPCWQEPTITMTQDTSYRIIQADDLPKLSPGNKWGSFWSGAVKWNFFNERFFKDVTWLSNGALRASYGQTVRLSTAHSSDGAVFVIEIPPCASAGSFGNPQAPFGDN
ncbi:hypothetical protein FQR65_LT15427 [Abscondita terminalis]|nr:hypothetical protein FQR65_LT15427 [Abscondita terminalis]